MSYHEPIHSGHFMTSNPHTEPVQDDEDEDVEVDVVEDDEKPEDIRDAKDRTALYQDEKPVTFYKFGPKKTQSIAIDVSLNKLNKCIKVAYNKMTTPKWKDFKGLRLHWKQRIRLNNVIWRAYYIEFGRIAAVRRLKKKTPFCYFAVPDDDTTHVKIEGSVLEGMYWKRRMEAVCAQYKKWRHYMKTRRVQDKPINKRKRNCSATVDGVFGGRNEGEPASKTQRSQTPRNTSTEYFDYDDYENVFTDSLFDSLNQPYMFPNPKELLQSGNADIMQPGLLSLQPSLEDIVATFSFEAERFDDEPGCSRDMVGPPPVPHSTMMRHSPSHEMRMNQSSPQPSSQMRIPPIQTQQSTPNRSSITTPPRMGPPQQQSQQQTPSRGPQDYVVANMLLDYSNQQQMMPTRQSSSITSQMLMMSSNGGGGAQPQYSTALYDHRNTINWKASNILSGNETMNGNGGLDYLPQYLHSQQMMQQAAQPMLAGIASGNTSRWWMDQSSSLNVSSSSSAQSPLSLSNTPTPLQPTTPLSSSITSSPMALSLDATSPLLLHSSTIRSPVVRPIENRLNPATTVLKALTHPLLQPQQQDNKHEITSKDWTNLRPLTIPTIPSNGRNNTASSSNEQKDEWKTSIGSLEPKAPIYSSVASYASALSRQNSESNNPTSHSTTIIKQQTLGEKLAEMKEEPQTISAPSSVKSVRLGGGGGSGSSRQVQADSTLHPEERKRILHLHAEQNRRIALKDGFDQLMDMIPNLYSGGVKPTNAVVLAKAAEQIRRLNTNKQDQLEAKEELVEKIKRLNQRISVLQSNLPSSSGAPSSKLDPRAALETFYDRLTREKSKKDWRFWVMSRMLAPTCVGTGASFANSVAPDGCSAEDVSASCSDWLNTHWRPTELRPFASSLLVELATTTGVLSNPDSLQDHVSDQIKK